MCPANAATFRIAGKRLSSYSYSRLAHNALPFLGYALLDSSIIKGSAAYDLMRVKASKEIIGKCNFWLPRVSQNV
jgi:hypothetical protein